jgi:hypothetical protein
METAPMPLDRNGLEILPRSECLRLLGLRPVGRVALSRYALPAILPVNFCMLDDQVVFASGTGSKSLAVVSRNVIAFEADEFQPGDRSGWSVLVVGIAVELDHLDPLWDEARHLDLHPWIGRRAGYLFRLPTDRISGRRLEPAAAARVGGVPAWSITER